MIYLLRNLIFCLTVLAFVACISTCFAQTNHKLKQEDKFRQLEEILPTANLYRTASGAPGTGYWQQQVDYEIDVRIDDDKQQLFGSERISYKNNSPDTLNYLWLQLDQNIRQPHSASNLTRTAELSNRVEYKQFKATLSKAAFDSKMKVTACVASEDKSKLDYSVVQTMMRVHMPKPLASGETFRFAIDWNYQINDAKAIWGRSGYEYFPEDKNYLYEMAQWFPRLCAYNDVTGWQHKQFLGRGEFTVDFGNYVVRITMPRKHVVTATGVLLNPDEVMSAKWRERLKRAEKSKKPVFIITPEEAKKNESSDDSADESSEEGADEESDNDATKTWIFKADRVRDFAFASSKKFIWDALQHDMSANRSVMAMSFYPNEAEPLWSKYSTRAIVHTLDVYSRYTFDYPYPVAISVNGPVGGMEYPMICFNGPRPKEDGTYSKRTKYGLISVIIHEVGHNYFPMIVNSDERQWTWMDEGLNTFLQYLTEQEWEENYPSRRGEPRDIVNYMKTRNQVPIMTNSESILQFGPNAYSKPATALNILRETVLGREQFDFAFKEYAQRWKFKNPMPADFFRTMEDASGVDLDWFWRGWFYSTDHVDLAITNVRRLNVNTKDPDVEKPIQMEKRDGKPESLSQERNKELDVLVDQYPDLKDFYNAFDELDVTQQDRAAYQKLLKDLEDDEKSLLDEKRNFYVIDLKNVGGLVMPVIFDVAYEDGSTEHIRIPAEIWRHDNVAVSKLLITEKEVKSITLDPKLETADTNLVNNHFPQRIDSSRMELFKKPEKKNAMQKAAEPAESEEESDSTDDDKQ